MIPARLRLSEAGYTLVDADTTGVTEMRSAQGALAHALGLAPTAGQNLDAMVDSLRDLPRRWPQARALALLWTGAESLIGADLAGWMTLTDVLTGAARTHPLGPAGLRFTALAVVDGFGTTCSR